ncbi:MAG: nucleotidyl transferase AbiEii/AbiGii toxin family protein [Gammaproteobacteria bacterium]|nr:nucleotidyl transferase AbiEii/AbiGii toxin family protein [Gammaproteobacteria bacterium]MCF6261000.1 nucleotidyl transferase AbiEii/AbiGii toxin family protein [Gammaproteobacteria bacterium]
MKDIAASVRQKLRNLAREQQEDFDYVLRQYVMQRLLYRLGCSAYADQFLLKGALLFWVWNENFHRPTRDIDLLSFGENDVPQLVEIFQQILNQDKADGLAFDVGSLKGIEIKEDADYPGVRLTGFADLARARIPFQIDVGYGDAVVPEAKEEVLPSFLDLPSPRLKVYPVYGVIAEKFQAMVMLGAANSRMKYFYDISVIAHTMLLDGEILIRAVKATFERRNTEFSTEPLYVFSDDFKNDRNKQVQWKAFLNKNNLDNVANFSHVAGEVQQLLEPVHQSIATRHSYEFQWLPEVFQWEK